MTVTNKVLVAFMVGLGLFFSLEVFLDAWRQVGHDDRGPALAASLGWMVAVALAVVATGLVLRRNGSDQRIKPLSIGVMLLLIVGGRTAFESLHAAGQVQIALALVGLLIGALVLIISGPTAPSGPKSGSAFPPAETPEKPGMGSSGDA